MRAIDRVLSHEAYKDLVRLEAPLRGDVQEAIQRVHPGRYYETDRGGAAHGWRTRRTSMATP